MPGWNERRSMKVPEGACAFCHSEWGDYWAEVDGQRMFFCCWICARAFDRMVQAVKGRTGWAEVDEIHLRGDYRGREGRAIHGEDTYRFQVKFNNETGEIVRFDGM